MPIKKSAILLMVLAACSFSLLVYAASQTLPVKNIPVECNELKGCLKMIEAKKLVPLDMFTEIILRPAA
ncbi:MAG: hypothetical protein ABJB11_08905 [Ferruginibacter sp.]